MRTASRPGTPRRVIVIGGGLAGTTAALDCAAAGAEVTLLESRGRLGGAAFSFTREGLHVDNGQHVFLRCCHAYTAFLARIGARELVTMQPHLRIPVLAPGGRRAVLERTPGVPAPLHLAASIVRYGLLSVRERSSLVRAMAALARLDVDDPAVDGQRFGDWLAARGQSTRAVEAVWDLITRPTVNLTVAEASLAQAAQVFQVGLLSQAAAADVGHARVPLSDIHDVAARAALERAGVDVRLRRGAAAVTPMRAGWSVDVTAAARADGRAESSAGRVVDEPSLGRVEAESSLGRVEAESSAGRVEADVVILAVPPPRAARLLPAGSAVEAERLARLGTSPIVNLHVVYDRPVLAEPFVAAVGSPVQWVFDRTAAGGVTRGQYLTVSLSAAATELAMTAGELRARFLPALADLFAHDAAVDAFFVTREHAATFRAGPGARALRPGPRTALPGLLLAGTWTDTGWPATMEGAVCSGHAAAQAALDVRTPVTELPDLPELPDAMPGLELAGGAT